MALMDNIFCINTASINVLTATGSLSGTSSFTLTSSFLLGSVASSNQTISASYASASNVAYSINFVPNSALTSTQSLNATSSISASYSTTTSYYNVFPRIKSGKLSGSAFGGTPLTQSVTFNTAYPNVLYSVSVIGGDARSWVIEQVSASSFIVSTNSTVALTDYVYWTSIYTGESP